MSERYEIATFFEVQASTVSGYRKLYVDNYGQGWDYQVGQYNGQVYKNPLSPSEDFTEPLPPVLVDFVKKIVPSQSGTNQLRADGNHMINTGFLSVLGSIQDVAKEMRKKEEELEKDYQRRIKLYKEDFQAELDEARKIIQMNKISNPVVNEEQPKPPMSPITVHTPSISQQQWDSGQECWVWLDEKKYSCGSNAPPKPIHPTNYETQEEMVSAWRSVRHKVDGVWTKV